MRSAHEDPLLAARFGGLFSETVHQVNFRPGEDTKVALAVAGTIPDLWVRYDENRDGYAFEIPDPDRPGHRREEVFLSRRPPLPPR